MLYVPINVIIKLEHLLLSSSNMTNLLKTVILQILQLHDEILYNHNMMNICEYEDQYKIVEERLCPEHKQDVTMRCSTCMRTICVECLDDDTACYGISQLLFLFYLTKQKLQHLVYMK